RRDILVDEQTLFDFYDQRVPADVASARHFDRWWKGARRDDPELLDLSLKELTNHAGGVSERDYPSFWSTSTPGAEQPQRLTL
ncbi:MAG: ATP-dependent helicase HrpA, partial [Pseudonocardiales bacterium]|nr:ATP-dependent helicase HrpA [Pseudonocardiales bacterium]